MPNSDKSLEDFVFGSAEYETQCQGLEQCMKALLEHLRDSPLNPGREKSISL